jgi:hypothetical protein
MPAKSSSFKRENLRTVVETEPLSPPVTYSDRIMLMGSCFTEHIGTRLSRLKFSVDLNPFGIVYNPLSIADQLEKLIHPVLFTRDDLAFQEDLWHSWMHHSRFSHSDPDQLLRTVNDQMIESSAFLKHADLLILTFGTTECFYLKSNNHLVSNCHKAPASLFFTRKPDPHELAGIWVPLIEALKRINPEIRICFTISPVRYFKDGPTGNQFSKSSLFLFIGMLMKTYPDLYYFPAYEIFMDDLRDYRFYDNDMLHPGPAGIEYVWNKFVWACIDPIAYSLMDEVDSIMKGTTHRPGTFLTQAHKSFITRQTERILTLQQKYPFLNFAGELQILEEQLRSQKA